MLVSPKWQTMWMESRHCSTSVLNIPLPSQQAKKILEDLRISCNSPNKTVQLEALKCWGTWINNHEEEDWKQNTVCYTAIRPLLTKKLQPLHKDVDVCKLKLSLMWTLLVKVQNIMQLEGPQYILEVFLQSCLTWLSSADGVDNEISILIFQLLHALFKKDVCSTSHIKEMFPPLSTDILGLKKVFHSFADKFLDVFNYFKKVADKNIVLEIWKCFLEQCEHSCETIVTPVWHKIFKIVGQICSESSEPVKERLKFLHGCATNLKTVLCSSKFIDCGNSLTTPCEALLKKLVELCTVEYEELCDAEMFFLSEETCRVLLNETIANSGYNLCIFVLDTLEEFSLKSLFWGIWCGLVQCFKTRLLGINTNQYTKMQMKFYRKLRGVAVNFELDKNYLHKDCLIEVESNIKVLSINNLCTCDCRKPQQTSENVLSVISKNCTSSPESTELQIECKNKNSSVTENFTPRNDLEKFSSGTVVLYKKSNNKVLPKVVNIKLDLLNDILKTVNIYPVKSLLQGLFNIQFISTKNINNNEIVLKNNPNQIFVSLENKKINGNTTKEKMAPLTAIMCRASPRKKATDVIVKETQKHAKETEDVISTPKTRSRKRAEEEIRKELEESQRRRKRKSFEVLVQEIVRNNKLRKTEKNTRKKSPVSLNKREKRNKKIMLSKKEEVQGNKRELRNSKNKDTKTNKEKKEINKPLKKITDGKLENYFKVITKKTAKGIKNNDLKTVKGKKIKKEVENKTSHVEKVEKKKKEIDLKQTSLKTMMNEKNKEEKKRQVMKTSNKDPVKVEKNKNEKKVKSIEDLAKLSPFKEVFHDHEYAKIEPSTLIISEHLITSNKKKLSNECVNATKEEKQSKEVVRTADKLTLTEVKALSPERSIKKCLRPKKQPEKILLPVKKPEKTLTAAKKSEAPPAHEQPEVVSIVSTQKIPTDEIQSSPSELLEKKVVSVLSKLKEALSVVKPLEETPISTEKPKAPIPAEKVLLLDVTSHKEALLNIKRPEVNVEVNKVEKPEQINGSDVDNIVEQKTQKTDEEFCTREEETTVTEVHQPLQNTSLEESKTDTESILSTVEEIKDEGFELNRGRKRHRMMDSLKSNKKIKIDPALCSNERQLTPLEIVEKENLEKPLEDSDVEMTTPTKEMTLVEKSSPFSKVEGYPKVLNSTRFSRALRMIALVPESTKPGQLHKEPSPKMEVSKNKKGPNMDKSSRASKMLALISENGIRVVEDSPENDDIKPADDVSVKTTTPNNKTPVSTLKSFNSVKKRKSIRFDDAKNETVFYQTDTPPSKILEEKEKYRKIKLQEPTTLTP